jgi:hypothetical protein
MIVNPAASLSHEAQVALWWREHLWTNHFPPTPTPAPAPTCYPSPGGPLPVSTIPPSSLATDRQPRTRLPNSQRQNEPKPSLFFAWPAPRATRCVARTKPSILGHCVASTDATVPLGGVP